MYAYINSYTHAYIHTYICVCNIYNLNIYMIYMYIISLDCSNSEVLLVYCVHRKFARTIKRPFELTYDPYTQTVQILDQPRSIANAIDSICSQMMTVTSAVKKLDG